MAVSITPEMLHELEQKYLRLKRTEAIQEIQYKEAAKAIDKVRLEMMQAEDKLMDAYRTGEVAGT